MEIHDEARIVSDMARIYGGSFAKSLFCDTAARADIWNLAKIKETWLEEWNKYLEFYELTQK